MLVSSFFILSNGLLIRGMILFVGKQTYGSSKKKKKPHFHICLQYEQTKCVSSFKKKIDITFVCNMSK